MNMKRWLPVFAVGLLAVGCGKTNVSNQKSEPKEKNEPEEKQEIVVLSIKNMHPKANIYAFGMHTSKINSICMQP